MYKSKHFIDLPFLKNREVQSGKKYGMSKLYLVKVILQNMTRPQCECW
jgi:hypothetical protein